MSSSARPLRKRKAASLKEEVPAKLPRCSPRTSKIRRDAFFAGARRRSERKGNRAPLCEISSSAVNELTSSPSNVPSSSPLPLFPSSPLKNQLLTPASTPDVTFLKKLKIAALGSDENGLSTDRFSGSSPLFDDFRDIRKPKLRKPMPTSFSFRNLNRSLVGYEPDNMHGIRLGKRAWVTQGFYSESTDLHSFSDGSAVQMPFCVSTFNQSPMVAVGYESGALRLIGTGDWSEESFLGKQGWNYSGFRNESASVLIHENAIFDLSVSSDDKCIATASGDQTCRVSDIERRCPVAVLSGHIGSVKQIEYCPSDDNQVLTASRDADVYVWDLRTTGTKMEDSDAINFQKPYRSILSGHRNGDKKGSITAAKWSTRNPYQFATASQGDAVVKVWDMRKSHSWKGSQPLTESEAPKPRFHNFRPHRDYGITSLTFSPDGTRLYALCKDGNLYAYSTAHMEKGPIHFYSQSKLKTGSFFVKSSISRDGEILATGSTDGSVVLFATDEKFLKSAEDDGLPIPHGAAASVTARRELMSGTGTALIEGHDGREVTDVTWDLNGNVISISDDRSARLWRNDDNGFRAEQLRVDGWSNGEKHGCAWSEGD